MADLWPIIVPAISAILGGVLGASGVVPLMNAYYANKRQALLDAQAMMNDMYKTLSNRVEAVEKSEKECLEAKEDLTRQVGELRLQVSHLQAELNEYVEPAIPVMIKSDDTGKILEVSGAVEKLFGWKAAELVGRQVEVLMPQYVRGAHRMAFAESAKATTPELRNVTLRDTFAMTKFGSKPVTIVLNSSVEDGRKWFEAEIHAVKLS